MAIPKEFIKAVEEQDNLKIRIMLKNSMLLDPTLEMFNEMLVYAEKQVTNLYDEHDGETLLNDENNWTKDYLDEQLFSVVTNFSKERIGLIKKMIKKLYLPKTESVQSNQKRYKGRQTNNKTYCSCNNCDISKRDIGTGLIVVGGVAIVAGVLIPKTVLTIAGVGAVAVGAGLVLKE